MTPPMWTMGAGASSNNSCNNSDNSSNSSNNSNSSSNSWPAASGQGRMIPTLILPHGAAAEMEPAGSREAVALLGISCRV